MQRLSLCLGVLALSACDAAKEGIPSSDPIAETDADGDGVPAYYDCDDDNAAIFPGAEETCDGIDNDCNGSIDDNAPGLIRGFADADGDGFGDRDVPVAACDPAGIVTNRGLGRLRCRGEPRRRRGLRWHRQRLRRRDRRRRRQRPGPLHVLRRRRWRRLRRQRRGARLRAPRRSHRNHRRPRRHQRRGEPRRDRSGVRWARQRLRRRHRRTSGPKRLRHDPGRGRPAG